MKNVTTQYINLAEQVSNSLTGKQDSVEKKVAIAAGLVAANVGIYVGLPVLYYKTYHSLGYSHIESQVCSLVSIESSIAAAVVPVFTTAVQLTSSPEKTPSQKPFSLRATFLSFAMFGAIGSLVPQASMATLQLGVAGAKAIEKHFTAKPIPPLVLQKTLD